MYTRIYSGNGARKGVLTLSRRDKTYVILLWFTLDDFTRLEESFHKERVKLLMPDVFVVLFRCLLTLFFSKCPN